jgi:hypothetical protein
VGPRAGPDDVERRKILPRPGLELRPLGRPARSQSLYRLRYPGFDRIQCMLVVKFHAVCSRCHSFAECIVEVIVITYSLLLD